MPITLQETYVIPRGSFLNTRLYLVRYAMTLLTSQTANCMNIIPCRPSGNRPPKHVTLRGIHQTIQRPIDRGSAQNMQQNNTRRLACKGVCHLLKTTNTIPYKHGCGCYRERVDYLVQQSGGNTHRWRNSRRSCRGPLSGNHTYDDPNYQRGVPNIF